MAIFSACKNRPGGAGGVEGGGGGNEGAYGGYAQYWGAYYPQAIPGAPVPMPQGWGFNPGAVFNRFRVRAIFSESTHPFYYYPSENSDY